MNLPPLPTLPPLPAMPKLPFESEYSPWFPMDRQPWEAGDYQVKFRSNLNVAGMYDPKSTFHWTPLFGWQDFAPGAVAIAWRGLARPAK